MEGKGRCVIVGGAVIGDYGFIRSLLREDDFFVYCDSGLRHMAGLRASPGLIVGDFDSYTGPLPDAETIVLPREKDDTDTVYAAKEALRRGFGDFLLIGVVGERQDHTIANISILLYLDSLGKRGLIADDRSEMLIVSEKPVMIRGDWAFFSLLSIAGPARGITVRGAKYPLENGEIGPDYQYGVSNEVLPGRICEVSVKNGRLLLVLVRALPGCVSGTSSC